MSTIDDLEERNAVFAREAFSPKDSLMPALRTIVISCVDPRVDPAHVLGLGDGEAVVIRNVGGRVSPAAIETLAMLGAVARGAGTPPGPGWNLIVLQHTDCGITRLPAADPMLASYFRVPAENLESLAIADPYRAVVVDVAEVGRYPLPPFSIVLTVASFRSLVRNDAGSGWFVRTDSLITAGLPGLGYAGRGRPGRLPARLPARVSVRVDLMVALTVSPSSQRTAVVRDPGAARRPFLF